MQGHYFNIHGQQMWFQGALLAFIGDTQANNRIGGYKESVSKAYRKCRQCLATNDIIQVKVKSYSYDYYYYSIVIMDSIIVCGGRIHLTH